MEKNKPPQAYDGEIPRYEGLRLDNDRPSLTVFCSKENYSTHSSIRKTPLPKEYQAQLLSINGIVETKDKKTTRVVRNPKTTDQGKILHRAPAGFLKMLEYDPRKLIPESVTDATIRKLFDELQFIPSYYPEGPGIATIRELGEELKRKDNGDIQEIVDYENMKVIALFTTVIRILIQLLQFICHST